MYSVTLHELGHDLGPGAFGRVVGGDVSDLQAVDHLSADDIAGIQALYGPPSTGGTAAEQMQSPTPGSLHVVSRARE